MLGKQLTVHLHRCVKLPCVTKHSTIIISNKEFALLASREYLKCNCLPLSRGDSPLESQEPNMEEIGIGGRNKPRGRKFLKESGLTASLPGLDITEEAAGLWQKLRFRPSLTSTCCGRKTVEMVEGRSTSLYVFPEAWSSQVGDTE